jgi:hypothetical protein
MKCAALPETPREEGNFESFKRGFAVSFDIRNPMESSGKDQGGIECAAC